MTKVVLIIQENKSNSINCANLFYVNDVFFFLLLPVGSHYATLCCVLVSGYLINIHNDDSLWMVKCSIRKAGTILCIVKRLWQCNPKILYVGNV